ncbi:MAG: ribosome assembly cofactor RimP [Bacteroidetes bacterium]|nr:ribosome assembly cofactor RimP [Bacteroidota bacterium]MBS1540657.1 ribosome assembly cofactor RimP [Bacteroidota bacterium]
MDWKEKIKDLAEKCLTDPAHFMVDVVVSKHKPMKFTLIVDGDHGVTIDDCAAISRNLNNALENLVEDHYTIEVTTPGLDHPLATHRQYVKNTGRQMKIHLTDKKIIHGVLRDVATEKIIIDEEVKAGLPTGKAGKKTEIKPREIPFTEIEKAFVTVSFK